jgi:hypothetical protein
MMMVGEFTPTEGIACKTAFLGIGLWNMSLCMNRIESSDHEILLSAKGQGIKLHGHLTSQLVSCNKTN